MLHTDENPVVELDEETIQPSIGATNSAEMTATISQQVLQADQMLTQAHSLSVFDVHQLKCLTWTNQQVSAWFQSHRLKKQQADDL